MEEKNGEESEVLTKDDLTDLTEEEMNEVEGGIAAGYGNGYTYSYTAYPELSVGKNVSVIDIGRFIKKDMAFLDQIILWMNPTCTLKVSCDQKLNTNGNHLYVHRKSGHGVALFRAFGHMNGGATRSRNCFIKVQFKS